MAKASYLFFISSVLDLALFPRENAWSVEGVAQTTLMWSLLLPEGFPLPFDISAWPFSCLSDGPRPRPSLPCLLCSLEWLSEIRTHRRKDKNDIV